MRVCRPIFGVICLGAVAVGFQRVPWRRKGFGTWLKNKEKLHRRGFLVASLAPEIESSNVPQKQHVNIIREMQNWGREIRVDGKYVVCNATTIEGVSTEYWRAVQRCIEVKLKAEKAGQYAYTANLFFTVPYCEDLKDYETMSALDKVLDFSQGPCVHYGKIVTLRHYHPNFPYDPKRRSMPNPPHPVFVVVIEASERPPQKEAPRESEAIQQNRVRLELLYNTVASSSADDSLRSHGAITGRLPRTSEEVLDITKTWVRGKLREVYEGHNMEYLARNLDTIYQFVVTGSSYAEEIYGDIYSSIGDLIAMAEASGCRSRIAENDEMLDDSGLRMVSASTVSPMQELIQMKRPYVSTFFVCPKFHTYNAPTFEKFGLTLSKALENLPVEDRLHVEIFHPEIVDKRGRINENRRSPFPTVHIYHHGARTTKKLNP